MQQSGIPGRMETISMEEYLNRRKEMKEKENRGQKEERETDRTDVNPILYFSLA